MSILSKRQDGVGFFYGWVPGWCEQVNVKPEGDRWIAFVGDEKVSGACNNKAEAEASALTYIKVRIQAREDKEEIETMACTKCGTVKDVDLLDGKDDGTGNFNHVECADCYGPGWASNYE